MVKLKKNAYFGAKIRTAMVFLYNSGIKLLYLIARLNAFFGSRRARKWVEGQQRIPGELQKLPPVAGKTTWFHFASLGEFEQGRPVLERIREQEPAHRIVISFFSPSGYEIRKNYPLADSVLYLPLDTASNARRFIDHVNPSRVIFTKYEYWYHFYRELKKHGTPLYVISAIFRKDQLFFKWYGKFFRKILACVTGFFVQNQESKDLLESIGFSNCLVSGDTRYDRVYENALTPRDIPEIRRFTGDGPCVIAGSTWPEEEKLLAGYVKEHPGWKYIIAPHEVNEAHLNAVRALFGTDGICYTEWINSGADHRKGAPPLRPDISEAPSPSVLIIDRMGMLSSVYRYGQIAFIGGGFGKGIHNILEAAVFGMPVLFGPNYHKFAEAHLLISAGCAFPVSDSGEFSEKLSLLQADEELRRKSSEDAKKLIEQHRGATIMILEAISRNEGNKNES